MTGSARGTRTPGKAARAVRRALRPRTRPVDLAVALLVGVLGFAAVVQVRSAQDDGLLASAREEDLVRILDDLGNRSQRLRDEVATLTDAQERLTGGTGRSEAAVAEARRRTQLLGILAGTVTATGPGVLLTIDDGPGADQRITAEVLLDALEELRDAGAEAVQLEGPATPAGPGASQGASAVRVVASTSFLDAAGGVEVDGVLLRAPYRYTVIGDSSTLASALVIPGGVVDTVERLGSATVDQRDKLLVGALRPLDVPQYARPADD